MRSSWPFRNFRFASSGLMSCRNIFRGCRACVFCVAPRIGGRQQSLSPRFGMSWQRGGRYIDHGRRRRPALSARCLETYLHYSEQLPNAALCFRGAAMPSTLDWDDAKMIYAKDLREPRPVAVITGCGSYLVQPRFFDQSLWDYSGAPSVAFYIDDIWISAWLSRRGVKRYVIPASARMRSVSRQRRTVSLNKIPGRQKLNNETIAFFRDAWDIIRPC